MPISLDESIRIRNPHEGFYEDKFSQCDVIGRELAPRVGIMRKK
jgi:hypothetical protein